MCRYHEHRVFFIFNQKTACPQNLNNDLRVIANHPLNIGVIEIPKFENVHAGDTVLALSQYIWYVQSFKISDSHNSYLVTVYIYIYIQCRNY